MDAKTLDKYITNHGLTLTKIREQTRYAIGDHPGIYRDPAKEAPDNRKPVPIIKKALAMIKGYMAKAGNITYTGDIWESVLKDVYWETEEELVTSETFDIALRHGQAVVLLWTENQKIRFDLCPPEQSIPIISTDLRPRMIGHIRLFKDAEDVETAEVRNADTIQVFKRVSSGWAMVEENSHPFGQVPAVQFTITQGGLNFFDHMIPLQDLLDKIVSEDYANELERYANAYLALAFALDQEGVDNLKKNRVFENVEGKISEAIQFVTKPTADGFVHPAADRIERLLYEGLQVLNPSDEKTSAMAVTGVALEMKAWPMELNCASIESYFSRGLYQLARLIIAGVSGLTGRVYEDDLSIKWLRNLPSNLTEIIEQAMKAQGILSDETIIRFFSTEIVPDVQAELDAIKAQKESNFLTIAGDGVIDEEN